MKEYRFPIDGYELSFSVPKAFMSDYWGGLNEKNATLKIDRSGKGASATLFTQVHMFAGPIWVGNYAAMDFSVMVIDADTTYDGSITSLEQLENYQKSRLALPDRYERYDFSRKTIAGETWLLMTLVRADASREKIRDDENSILCFPLGGHRFLQMYCRITESVPNKAGRWLADAHIMRDQILDSVVLGHMQKAQK